MIHVKVEGAQRTLLPVGKRRKACNCRQNCPELDGNTCGMEIYSTGTCGGAVSQRGERQPLGLTKHPHALIGMFFPGGGASLRFQNVISHFFYCLISPSTQNGSSMKAEEKLCILLTAVSLTATGTWDIAGAQQSNDGIKY